MVKKPMLQAVYLLDAFPLRANDVYVCCLTVPIALGVAAREIGVQSTLRSARRPAPSVFSGSTLTTQYYRRLGLLRAE